MRDAPVGDGRTAAGARRDGGRWFSHGARSARAWCQLFCFPYAGGSGAAYARWPDLLGPGVEVLPITLPGHVGRLREPPITRMAPLAHQIADAITRRADRPFAFLGHSMGALLCFEVARLLDRRNLPPWHLVVSGSPAPASSGESRQRHLWTEEELIEEMRRLGGTPAGLLADRDLMDCLLPALRADFEVIETYRYHAAPPLDASITAIGGADDPDVSLDDLCEWEAESTAECGVHLFPGGHFFLHTAERQVASAVRASLTRS